MFISTAWAQGAEGGGGDAFLSLMPIVLIFAVFYFLIIRPQQKKHKQHREAVAAVRRGDRVTTGGGIVGTVVRVEEGSDEIVVEIAEGIRVRVKKHTLMDIYAKSVPANDTGKK
jgi:preprotein translocase subunit YajC